MGAKKESRESGSAGFVSFALEFLRKNAMVVALAAAMLLFQFLLMNAGKGSIFTPANISNLFVQNAYVIILAVGMMLCIVSSGNIDLSVGSVVVLVSAVVATLISPIAMGLPIWIGIVAGLLLGLIIGAWQGFWIAYVRIPAFIVTLAGMLLFRGVAQVVLQGRTIGPFTDSFQRIFQGYLPDGARAGSAFVPIMIVAGIATAVFIASQIYSRLRARKADAEVGNVLMFVLRLLAFGAFILLIGYFFASNKGIPTPFLIVAFVVAIYSYLTQRTVPGRHLYAMGGNEKAARLSGINTNKMLFFVYMNMGLLAGVAALVTSARLNGASPQAGTGYELDAIASNFIGGVSAFGGIGRVGGVVIGALFMGVLNMGMSLMGIEATWQMAVKGLVLLVAVVFDVVSKRQAKTA